MATEYMKIQENADWYYANLDSLLPKYCGRFVGVVDRGVFGAYDDCLEGVLALEKAGNPRGTFIVHKCIPLEEEKKEWALPTPSRAPIARMYGRRIKKSSSPLTR